MGAFEYTVLDDKGHEKKGVMEGDTPRQIRQQLREKGWTPLEVEEVQQRETKSGKSRGYRRGWSALDLALVTRQLATLLHSGMQLEESLGSVAKQSEKSKVERILFSVRSRVREGHSLAAGLAGYPRIFNELYCKTVEAGEQSGHLEVVLERLADYTENRQQMRQKTLLALFYPAILTVMAILIVSGLLAYVVPKVVDVFDNAAAELPTITKLMIACSDFIRDYGLFILAAIFIAIPLGKKALQNPQTKHFFHNWLLTLPLIGKLIRSTNTARFARTLSILAASSVPILEALRISSQVLTNLPMRKAVEEVTHKVREGSNLSSALEKTGYFPPMALSLIHSGESSGDLEGMLDRAAMVQEREVETVVAAFLGLFEPILIMVMGILVLLIVIAILLPIFNLNELITA